MSGTDPLVGAMIGRYRVTRTIGRGGMGRVYLGIHPEIGSRVAIKVLADDLADSPELLERFFAEARMVNLIKHENIINVLDLDRMTNGRPFIVMEFVDGRSLRQVVELGNAPLGGVVHAMLEVLLALDAAHAAGVVHRDLKPDNVMLTESGRAKVLDFGIAKLATQGPRTRTGASLGTPEYMAPEQILGEPVDARTDVYAAGVMLFELVTGRRPFEGATDYQLMEGHLRGAVPSAAALRAEITPGMQAVIEHALAKRPEDRFQSARAMARALRTASAELAADQWHPLSVAWYGTPPTEASLSFEALPAATDSGDTLPARPPDRASTPTIVERPSAGRLDEGTRSMHGAPPAADPPPPPAPVAAPAPAPAPRARRRGPIAVLAAIALGGGVVAWLATRDRGPEQLASAPPPPRLDAHAPDPDAAALVAPADAQAAADAAVPSDGPDPRDAAVHDARSRDAALRDASAPPADALIAQATPPAHAPVTNRGGWRPDKTWGLSPPIKTEPTTPPRHSQTFSHDLVDADPSNFDAGAWAPVALRIARELEPDAQLTGFDSLTGPTGKAYFTGDAAVRMWFHSAEAAASGDATRLPCIVILPTPKDVTVRRYDLCPKRAVVRLPRCRLAEVFPGKVAVHDGMVTANVAYGAAGWQVDQSNSAPTDEHQKAIAHEVVADDCD